MTLNEASQKQVEFIPKVYGVSLRKYNLITISAGGYEQKDIKAASKVKFLNSQQNDLGIALPKGTFRVFKQDEADGSLEFIGEDSIGHTPKDENITLNIGNAFDISANLYAVSRTSFKDAGYRASMNLTIVNHKDTASDIEVELNNYYGSNLKLSWSPNSNGLLEQVSANKYRMVGLVQPDQTVVYSWVESYTP